METRKVTTNFFRAGFMFTLGAALATPVIVFIISAMVAQVFNVNPTPRVDDQPTSQDFYPQVF
jgi:hypothetical protein